MSFTSMIQFRKENPLFNFFKSGRQKQTEKNHTSNNYQPEEDQKNSKVPIADTRLSVPERFIVNIATKAENRNKDFENTLSVICKAIGVEMPAIENDLESPDHTRYLQVINTAAMNFAIVENECEAEIDLIHRNLNRDNIKLIPIVTVIPDASLAQMEKENDETIVKITQSQILMQHEDTIANGIDAKTNITAKETGYHEEVIIKAEAKAKYYEDKVKNFESRLENILKSIALDESSEKPEMAKFSLKSLATVIKRLRRSSNNIS